MQIKANATELAGTDVQKVSLVRHAANRRPFQILKSEPLPADGSLTGLAKKVQGLFKSEAPQIVAVLVNKAAAKNAFPVVKAAGLRVEQDHATLLGDDVVVLKQEGYDEQNTGDVIALSEDIAVVLNKEGIAKSFCSWHASSDFTETLTSQSFYPSMRMAQEALMDTVYAIGSGADTPEEMGEKLDAALSAFKNYVMGLHKTLPVEVFRTAQKLAHEFEGSTVATTDTVSKNEGEAMKKTNDLQEAVAGDLAGIFKTEAEVGAGAAATAEADAAAAAAAATEDAGATDAAAAAATAGAEGADTSATDAAAAAAAVEGGEGAEGAAVAKGEPLDAAGIIEAVKNAFGPTALAVVEMQKAIAKQDETIASLLVQNTALTERVAKSEQSAATAVKKAENTVVVHDIGADLGTLHTRTTATGVTKSAGGEKTDVWKGLFPGLDALENAARAQHGE